MTDGLIFNGPVNNSIMITSKEFMETKIVTALDLFVPNDVLRFDLQPKTVNETMPRIGAISVVAEETELPREMEILDKACVAMADPLIFDNKSLEGYTLWLFLAHELLQQKSVMVRHRKLWKSLPSELTSGGMQLHPEMATESSEGIKYFGAAEVRREALYDATRILRCSNAATLILSKKNYGNSETEIIQLFEHCFPKKKGVSQNEIDWLNLAIGRCPYGDIVIRVSGEWDEREASIDLIMLNELISLVETC